MIWRLRNIVFRFWVTALLSVPLCFFAMPRLLVLFPGLPFILVGLTLVLIVLGLVHWMFNFLGHVLMAALVKEAQTWERAGVVSQARKSYARVARLYDSFLFSPIGVEKKGRRITEALARFGLTSEPENPQFYLATEFHLRQVPEDGSLAQLYLARILSRGRAGAKEEDILSRLAEVHHANYGLAPLLAKIFLDLGREDYNAKQVYQFVLENKLIPEERLDQIRQLTPETSHTLGDIDGSFQSIEMEIPSPALDSSMVAGKAVWVRLKDGLWGLGTFCMKGIGGVIFTLGKQLRSQVTLPQGRRYLKYGGMVVIGLGFFLLVINTVNHFVELDGKGGTVVEKKIAKPFTIQVAAYLKESHASQYVGALSKQGISASIKAVGGGGKTWYLVRVSEFVDKESATAYGDELKAEKIIEDFFVSNK